MFLWNKICVKIVKTSPPNIFSRGISNSTRRAKAKLFLEHTWMKYSKTQDSVYCAPCRFFGPYMLIVFDSKSSLIQYTFDKIKFLSQLHICIILLYLIFDFSKFMFKSWLVAHENWVSMGSFLVPGNCKNAGFGTIYPRPPAVRTPLRGGEGFRDSPPDF